MDIDWNLLETFLRVAEAGSSTAAAERLAVSQPTVSRRVAELEEALGVTLFVRHARGFSLTERGAQLLERAQGVGDQVEEVLRRAAGMRLEPRGEVRVSVNEPLGIYVLTPALEALHRQYPELEVELVIDNRSADLNRRQADVAVRMFEPRGADLIARHVGDTPLGLFASEAYLRCRGAPRSLHEPGDHVLIGGDTDPTWRRFLEQTGLARSHFHLRTDSLVAHVEAMRAGVGIGATHLRLAERFGLVRVLPEVSLEALPVWLVAHAELRTSVAVRRVLEFLEATLRAWLRPGR